IPRGPQACRRAAQRTDSVRTLGQSKGGQGAAAKDPRVDPAASRRGHTVKRRSFLLAVAVNVLPACVPFLAAGWSRCADLEQKRARLGFVRTSPYTCAVS